MLAVAIEDGWYGEMRVGPDGIPLPSVILASSPARECDACGGRALAPWEYCLDCDRYGLDGAFFPGRIDGCRVYRGPAPISVRKKFPTPAKKPTYGCQRRQRRRKKSA
jgi:hypothetical protein